MRLPAAALLILAAAPAGAQQRPPAPTAREAPAGSERATMMVEPAGMLIAGFDSDGDGRVSAAEREAGVAHSFHAIDTSNAGKLGYIEFADWAERWLGDRNALPSPFGIDTDGDDAITLPELQAAIAHVFDRFDANHDGQVTRAELLTIHAAPGGGSYGTRGKRQRRDGGGG